LKLNFLEKFIGSAFFSGYMPFAPGTFGSIVALIIYLLPGFENPVLLLLLISVFSISGIFLGTKFETVYGKDPKQCTIDEMVGMWISLLFLPKEVLPVLTAFAIWRILDIVKPFPANLAEKIDGGLGIMLDDIIAAIYTLAITHILIYIFF